METVIIENVDFELLEAQRKSLDVVIEELKDGKIPSRYEIDHIAGIRAMLDVCSDKRFFD